VTLTDTRWDTFVCLKGILLLDAITERIAFLSMPFDKENILGIAFLKISPSFRHRHQTGVTSEQLVSED